MAEQFKKALTEEMLKDLEVSGREARMTDNMFGERVEESHYDGNDNSNRKFAPFSYLKVLGKYHDLGNPNRTNEMSGIEAANSLHAHYSRTLSARNEASVKLLRSLAEAGEKAGTKIARSKDGSARFAGHQEFAIVSKSVEEAEFIGKMIDFALELMPRSNASQNQKVIFNVEDMPSEKQINKALFDSRPALWQNEDDKKIALIADMGLASNLIQKAADTKPVTAINPHFVFFDKAMMKPAIDANFKKHSDQNSGKTITSSMTDLSAVYEQKLEGIDFVRAALTETLAQSDKAIFQLNTENKRTLAWEIAAEAARQGKLQMAFNQNGELLNVNELARTAMQEHGNKGEKFVARTMDDLAGVHVASPEGRLVLGKILEKKSAQNHDRFVNAIANSWDGSVGDLLEASRDEERRNDVYAIMSRVGNASEPMNILSGSANNNFTISFANKDYKMIMEECEHTGTSIIGPEQYPDALLAAGINMPPVLYVQGAGIDNIDPKDTVSFIGDKVTNNTIRDISNEIMSSASSGHQTPVFVENSGFDMPERGGVMVITTGHMQTDTNNHIDWSVTETGLESENFSIIKEENGVTLINKLTGHEVNQDFSYESASSSEIPATIMADKGLSAMMNTVSDDEAKYSRGKVKVQWEMEDDKLSAKGANGIYTIGLKDSKAILTFNHNNGKKFTKDKQDVNRNTVEAWAVMNTDGNNKDERAAIAAAKSVAGKIQADIVAKPIIQARQKFIENGGVIISTQPPVHSGSTGHSISVNGKNEWITSLDKAKTNAPAQRAAQDIVARISDNIVVTQLSSQSEVNKSLAPAVASGKTISVVTPGRIDAMRMPEINGNIALIGFGRQKEIPFIDHGIPEMHHDVKKAIVSNKIDQKIANEIKQGQTFKTAQKSNDAELELI